MSRTARVPMAAGLVLVACLAKPATVPAAPLRYSRYPAELSLSALGERTVQIVLAPLDEKGKARPAPPSTVLVEQKPQLKLRRRELSGAEEVSVGKLRVQVRPQPLTLSIRGPSGKPVQELTFADAGGSISFRVSAPVLGMGEGAKQLDRRGAVYTMKDGWGAWDRSVYGSWVAVPFLIGTDGWALFVHQPRGQFDLRSDSGRFQPAADGRDFPLELFVTAWNQPADVLQEYIRLTGRPVMPPKWALGYMQSHRTLSGPGEVLQVARTCRAKKLPCDALIYLGTGYCPAGWNLGHGSGFLNGVALPRGRLPQPGDGDGTASFSGRGQSVSLRSKSGVPSSLTSTRRGVCSESA